MLFFARYESNQLGSLAIEAEHLLVGLIRERPELMSRILARAHRLLESIRNDIERRTVWRLKVAASLERVKALVDRLAGQPVRCNGRHSIARGSGVAWNGCRSASVVEAVQRHSG